MTRVTCCDRGYDAQGRGEFIYLPHANAFVFTGEDAPTRSLSWRVRYYWPEDTPDPTGQAYTWVDCPFCGRPLPRRAPSIMLPPGDPEL